MARQPSTRVYGDAAELPAGEGTWCTVRVRGPEGAVDAALPAAATVAEVVDELAGRMLPGAPLVRGADGRPWYLHRAGAGPLPPGISLTSAGIRDGDVLHLGPWPMPRPAQPVDDGLVALAEGAARVPRWTVRRAGVLVAALLVAVSGVGAFLALALPGGPLVPLALALMLLGLAAVARRGRPTSSFDDPDDALDGDGSTDLPTLGAGLASLLAWVAAGGAAGVIAHGGVPLVLTLGGAALALGAGLAWLVVGERGPWWAAAGTLGAGVALPSALVSGGVLAAPRALAVVLTLWLVLLLTLPWIVTRGRTWLDPRDDPGLVAHAATTRHTLDLGAAAGSAAAAVGLWVLATSASGGGMILGFCAAVSLAAALRARRSAFVVESASAIGAATVGLAAIGWATVVSGGPVARTAVVIAAVGLLGALAGLGGALRTARRSDDGIVAWWRRPRTQRLLGWLETASAVAVLPLLAGVLGIYAAAADAGARF